MNRFNVIYIENANIIKHIYLHIKFVKIFFIILIKKKNKNNDFF